MAITLSGVGSRWSFDASAMNDTETTMTKTNMDLSALLAKHDQGNFLRGIAKAVLQLIMPSGHQGIYTSLTEVTGLHG
jgi:hypothetical protein